MLHQTFIGFEFIIINDGSTDKTLAILNNFNDISQTERLTKQVDFLETHPEIGVCGTGVKITDDSNDTLTMVQLPYSTVFFDGIYASLIQLCTHQ